MDETVMDVIQSRRHFLATSGMSIIAINSGCVDFGADGESKFRLKTVEIQGPVHGSDIAPYLINPLEIESKYSIELSDTYKQNKIKELVKTGTVDTRAWELSYQRDWGPIERDKRTCFEYNGTYYRVWVESREEVKRERWVFYFDWNDQNPSNHDKIITLGDNGLSNEDQEIIEAAQEMIPEERDVPYDRTIESYALVFHEELDPNTSALVPDPPFDYLEHDGEYFRAVSERGAVDHPEQTFSVEAVADSFEQYQVYAEETFPDARFSNVDLSAEATDVLKTAIDIDEGFAYEEEPPLSEALEEVLDHLTITEYLEPHDSYDDVTWFSDALAEYRHRWYEFTLIIYPEDYETY